MALVVQQVSRITMLSITFSLCLFVATGFAQLKSADPRLFTPDGVVHIDAFDPREATISSTHHALYTGLSTCRTVVSSFLSRIEELNNVTNAIISLNPHALTIADQFDQRLKENNGSLGRLFCIPVLLKDNFDTADMPTTGGSLSLSNSQPSSDAVSVAALKNADAIIIGKTNMHELALEGLTVSSLGGQTVNPYDFTRTPGGSSGGTAAAVAASFAVWGTGSDTINSLRSPANANSLYSCRPTRGLISRSGVMPNSYTQDAVGPIARCVEDVAVALTVMAGIGNDPTDNTTALVPQGIHGIDYTTELTFGSLKGLRLGMINNFFNMTTSDETTPVNVAFAVLTLSLQQAGVSVIEVKDDVFDSRRILETLDTQQFEYREGMDRYLQNPSLTGEHPSSLSELYSGDQYLVIPSQYDLVKRILASSTSKGAEEERRSYEEVQDGIEGLKEAIEVTFKTHRLDALIYPQQMNLVAKLGSPSQSGRNGILAAVTGYPVISIPIGHSQATDAAPEGVPIGMEILGQPWTEPKLLQIAYQIQGLGKVRRTPRWAKASVPVKEYSEVPRVVPNRENIPAEYPVGRLM